MDISKEAEKIYIISEGSPFLEIPYFFPEYGLLPGKNFQDQNEPCFRATNGPWEQVRLNRLIYTV